MRKLLVHAIAFFMCAVATSMIVAADAETRAAVVDYFLGGNEPTVEAASWTSEKEFTVGVHYMGSPENSFARYVCSVLAKRGLNAGTSVVVVDINSMNADPKQWEVVGEAVCK